MLVAENISFNYTNGTKINMILKNLQGEFSKGTFYTILGRSGSGKTTLLSLLSALDSPSSGNIEIDGTDIEKIGLTKYRRNNIGIVFQHFNLIPYMNGLQNVRDAMSITNNRDGGKDEALSILNSLGIDEEKAKRPINKLSGGEQQRVAIARALSTDVDIILADEPTGNLDKNTQNEIIGIFQKLAHEQNKCVIVVTHSQDVSKSSDITLRMDKGKLK